MCNRGAPGTTDIVICGAGIVGVAAADHLVVRHGIKQVVLVDERELLSLTSARERKPTEISSLGRMTPWPKLCNAA